PRSNVDPVAVVTLPFNDDITEVDANAELHPTVGRQLGVAMLQLLLDLDRTLHRVYHTRKFSQQVIAGRVYYSATVPPDEGGHHLAVGGQGADGGFFILAHEAAVAFNIGTEDRGELAFHSRFYQGMIVPFLYHCQPV